MRKSLVAVLALVSVLAIGWLVWQEAKPRRVPIIVYLVDTLRADRLGAYGYVRDISPEIDRLARESVIFEHAYAPSPWTLPSVASLVTSTFSCEHGILEKGKKLSPQLKTLAEVLSAAGYFTAISYNNIWAGPIADLSRGYEAIEYRQRPYNKRLMDAKRFLKKADDRPFMFYFHTIEPHDLHLVPRDIVARFRDVEDRQIEYYKWYFHTYSRLSFHDPDVNPSVGTLANAQAQDDLAAGLAREADLLNDLYDAGITWADQNVAEVIDYLKETGVWDEAIFVFLSDHGEEFGEHDGWFHTQSVYEELVRVPLIIHFPGNEFAGRVVDTPVSLVDVMPTLLDYIGESDACDTCRGRSLLQTLRDPDREPAQPPQISALRMNVNWRMPRLTEARGDVNLALHDGRLKGIWNAEPGRLELYDLATDPGERDDLSETSPVVAAAMGETARTWLDGCASERKEPGNASAAEITEQQQREIRALGYFN